MVVSVRWSFLCVCQVVVKELVMKVWLERKMINGVEIMIFFEFMFVR